MLTESILNGRDRSREVLLDVENLTAGYSGVPVVRGVSLQVREGEIVALLGPNGAGKTTTLLTISGLLRVLGGHINVLGAPTSSSAPQKVARRGVAHVAEDRSLFFQLTTRENLVLAVRGPRSRQGSLVDEAFDLFPPLRNLTNRRAGLLSGGEQQMLVMARAIASKPKLLLIDEMSLGLAPLIVERLLDNVRDVVRQLGIGTLLVEQHVHLALEAADRAYVMSHGEVVLEDSAAALLKRVDLLETSYLGGDLREG